MNRRLQFAGDLLARYVPASLALALLLVACADRPSPPEAPSLRSLLARGAAHGEIDQWAEALELFGRASRLDPAEPVAAYDLAIAHFRSGDRTAAREHLERARSGATPELRARLELLRGRLAYEDGDESEEIAAHLEATRLAPEEPAYAYALSQLHLRLGDRQQRGTFLQQAHRLWPENAFLATEVALWALAQADDQVRRRGLSVLEPWLRSDSGSEMAAYLEKGRLELDALGRQDGDRQARVPRSLRIAVNLLRATQRFQSDAAELQARLEPVPLSEPAAGGPRIAPEAAPEIVFEIASLVPDLALAAGEELIAAVRVDHAVAAPSGPREAGIALASDRALYFLAPEDRAFRRLGELGRPVRQLLAGDVDDDQRMELLVLTGEGPRLWGGSLDWAEVPLEPRLAAADLRRALLVDFEHDGDLDLLATDGSGLVLSTNRGEAGLGPPLPAPLPVDAPVHRLASADLDADADQDLLLATATELLVLRNWRQGEFAIHARLPLPRGESVSQLLVLDYDADGHMDVVALVQRRLIFWRGDGRARLHPDPTSDTAFLSDRIRPLSLLAADLDLDGDQDLLVAGAGAPPHLAGLVALFNDGGRFVPRTDFPPWPAARGALALDLDGDRDPDLLSWADAGLLRAFRGRGAEDQSWLALRLRAPERKVPRDARGVRLQVVAGDVTQWLEPGRPNLILGLGRGRPALIKATWPNGISEYLFEPAAETEHTLELSMRVEGSCPFLYASDGRQLRFVTDILGLAPVGMLATAKGSGGGHYVPADPEEYLRLPDWVAEGGDGMLELAITEELREALYLDQAELLAVDAPAAVEVYNGEQWLREPIVGLQLRLLTTLAAPVSVLDDRGREVLDVVRRLDHRYLRNHSGANRYQGAVAPHRLTIELPPEVAAAERPALLLVGWLHWGNTSTNVARSQDPDGAPMFPVLEVPDGTGGWRPTTVAAGLPAGKTKPVVVDLGGAVDPADPRVRLTTDFEVYWDLVATASLLPTDATPHRVHRLAPSSAELRWRGFSRWYRPAVDGPYLFDYADRRDVPWRLDSRGRELTLSWQELEGYYTAFGRVTALLERADDYSVVLASGEEVKLRFDVASLPAVPAGWRRTFFLHSEGWEKDGDPNVSCARTVEPLPYRGMVHDPCSGLAAEPGPAGAPRTRWVGRDRLARRVAAGW